MILKTTLLALSSALFMGQALAADPGWTDAEVKRIDTARQRIVLKHGEIPNLEMPGMTMAFGVRNPDWLTQLKPGQTLQVKIEELNGALTITAIQ